METPSILVVDDDFLVRIHITDILEDAGFEVVEADDAAGAMALLQQNSDIQLVCTDVDMPGELDGIDLVLHMRARHPEVRAIVISGHAKNGARAPDVPFLTKPLVSSRLLELVRKEFDPVRRLQTVG